MFKELNILKVFLEEPSREFNVREIGRLLKTAPATASGKLRGFAAEGILKERKERRMILYRSNLENEMYRDLKRFYNIRKIKESGLLDVLSRFYLKPSVVLFGSAAQGLDTETSDFDILIISEKTADFPEKERFEKALNRKLQLFIVRSIKDLKNEHLMNNALNGIVLQGELNGLK